MAATTSLTSIKCVPCRGGEPTLSVAEAKKLSKEIDGKWVVEGNASRLIRNLSLKDFKTAISFIDEVAGIAEQEGHHPNIYLYSYNKVKLELWTHKIGGLHKNDFILAAKIDRLIKSKKAFKPL